MRRSVFFLVLLVAHLFQPFSATGTPKKSNCTADGWCQVFRISKPLKGRWLGKIWASGPNNIFCRTHQRDSPTQDHRCSANSFLRMLT